MEFSKHLHNVVRLWGFFFGVSDGILYIDFLTQGLSQTPLTTAKAGIYLKQFSSGLFTHSLDAENNGKLNLTAVFVGPLRRTM